MSKSQQHARALEDILIAAKKHPQSNVAKLIYTVREEPTQRNICLLLVELSKNKDFYTDFSVQLGYYLNLFQEQPSGADVLNQAGLLLLASADIYARRVDYIQELVHLLNTSLSKADKEIEETKKNAENEAQQQANTKQTPEPAKRVNRKRLVDAQSDPFEIDLVAKKLKTISKEKRNTGNKPETKAKFNYRSSYSEDHIHPALYLLSSIVDLDNEADVESKKNFQSFTYRLEHRYSTLVPDVNFRLHFVVKDYLDEESERMREQTSQDSVEGAREWPPLSEEYLQNLITLENQILSGKEPGEDYEDSDAQDASHCHFDDFSRQVLQSNSTLQNQSLKIQMEMFDDLRQNAELNSSMLNASQQIDLNTNTNANDSAIKETTLGQSSFDSACIIANSTITNENALTQNTQNSENMEQTDSGLGESFGSQSSASSGTLQESTTNSTPNSSQHSTLNTTNTLESSAESAESSQANNTTAPASDNSAVESTESTLDEIRVKLPHHTPDDEGVLFSELGVQEQRMLSPSVLAIDILPQVPNKEKLTIVLDDELKELLNVDDDESPSNAANTFELPNALAPPIQPLKLNILKIHEKHFKRRTLFKLCADFELFMKARNMKRKRYEEPPTDAVRCLTRQLKLFKAFQERQELTHFRLSPSGSDNDFYGFDNSHLENERAKSEELETMSLIFDEDFHGFQDSEIDCFVADESSTANAISGADREPPAADSAAAPTTNVERIPAALATEHSASSAETDNPNTEPAAATENLCSSTLENDTALIEDAHVAEEDVGANSDEVDFALDNNKKSSIQMWHEALRPVLAGSSERHHFNIFDLGTNILDIVQANNNTATLSDVMADKDMSFCPRYFLSMLILATHNNIELNVLNKSEERPCEWSDVQFSLLSTRRHALAPEDDICIVNNAKSSIGNSSTNTLKTKMQTLKKSIVTTALPVERLTSASTPSSVLLTPPETPPVTPPTLPRLPALTMATQLSTASTPVQAFNKATIDTPLSLTGRCPFVGKNTRKRLASSDEFNVNLNTFRIVQPIEQIPIQNDEQDSGFCSNECRSAL